MSELPRSVDTLFGDFLHQEKQVVLQPGVYHMAKDKNTKLVITIGNKNPLTETSSGEPIALEEGFSQQYVKLSVSPLSVLDRVRFKGWQGSEEPSKLGGVSEFLESVELPIAWASVRMDIQEVDGVKKIAAQAKIEVDEAHQKKGIGKKLLKYYEDSILTAAKICGYSGYTISIAFADDSKGQWSTRHMEEVGLQGYKPLERYTKGTNQPHFSKSMVVP